MNALLPAQSLGILAQIPEDRLMRLGDGFKQVGHDDNTLLISAIAGVILITIVVLVVRRLRAIRVERARRHVDVMTTAIERLGLSDADASALRAVAREANLREPTAMLLSPANLAMALENSSSFGNDIRIRKRIDSICREVFDVTLPVMSASAGDQGAEPRPEEAAR